MNKCRKENKKSIDLHSTMDAKIWTEEFCKRNSALDEGTMLCWFANAIMAGYDIAKREEELKIIKP